MFVGQGIAHSVPILCGLFLHALRLVFCIATAWIAWTAAARDSFLAFSGIGTCSRARCCTESKQLGMEKHLFPSHRLPLYPRFQLSLVPYDKASSVSIHRPPPRSTNISQSYRRAAPQTRPGPCFSTAGGAEQSNWRSPNLSSINGRVFTSTLVRGRASPGTWLSITSTAHSHASLK